MAARKAALPEDCHVISDVLARIGDKWTVLVVWTLGDGTKRFNELRRRINGISQRMLTLTLRSLERDGMVTRSVYPTIPPRVDYTLTDLGRSLLAPVMALGDWATKHREEIEAARQHFEAKSGSDARAPRPAAGNGKAADRRPQAAG